MKKPITHARRKSRVHRRTLNHCLRRLFSGAELKYLEDGTINSITIDGTDWDVFANLLSLTPKEITSILAQPVEPRDLTADTLLGTGETRRGRTLSDHISETWSTIHDQCYNKDSILHGISGSPATTVCEEWSDLAAFKEWAMRTIPMFHSHRYPTLTRRDRHEGYTPTNCLWA